MVKIFISPNHTLAFHKINRHCQYHWDWSKEPNPFEPDRNWYEHWCFHTISKHNSKKGKGLPCKEENCPFLKKRDA